jgi:hypothetical protein
VQTVPGSGDGLAVVRGVGHRGDGRDRLSGRSLERELRPALGLASAVCPPAEAGAGSTGHGPSASGPAAQRAGPRAGKPGGSRRSRHRQRSGRAGHRSATGLPHTAGGTPPGPGWR